MKEYWFDEGPLTVEPTPMPRPAFDEFRSTWAKGGVKGRLSALRNAHANGLGYLRHSGVSFEQRPGMVFRGRLGDRDQVVTWDGPPSVEFANYNYRRGDAGSRGARRRSHQSSLDEGNDPFLGKSPLRAAGRTVAHLDLGTDAEEYFRSYGARGQEAAARGLMSGAALGLMCETAESFDIEITDAWLFLYGYHFDVSTEDPEMWAWISVTSRLLDQIHAWGGPAHGEAPAAAPFYTTERVRRPAKLDILSSPTPGLNAVANLLWGRDGLGTP